jgi:hypothetical protein
MSVLFRILLLMSVAGVLCFADINLTATNPNFKAGESSNGTPVIGDATRYGIQDFSLSDVGTAWTLTIDTNYGTDITGNVGAIPGFCDQGGPFPACPGSLPFFMSDFLIQQGSTFYGVVLSSHSPLAADGYAAGNLYDASSVVKDVNFGKGPVILGTEISQLNTGGTTETVSANAGCNGTNCAKFKIVDTFTAPASFLNTSLPLTIYASSADCYNGFLTVTTPEPSGLVWLVPGLLLLGSYLRRRSLARVK